VKTSAGATSHQRIAKVGNLHHALEEMKSRNIWLIGLDGGGEKDLFDVDGNIQGFVPNGNNINSHYRDSDGNIVFYQYHFKNWMRSNLPLINRARSAIGDLRFFNGSVNLNGKEPKIVERWVTNINSGFDSSMGTGGRGSIKIECIVPEMKVTTFFIFPREFIKPERIQEAFNVICENGGPFGASAKVSTGRLVNPKVEMVNQTLWTDD